jgi:hypothetical protein
LGVRRNKAGLNGRQRPLLISQQRTDGKQVNKVVTPKAGFSTQPDRAWNEAADNVVSNEAYVEFSFIDAVCVCEQFRGGRNNPICRGNQPFDVPRRPAKVRMFARLFHTSINVTLAIFVVNFFLSILCCCCDAIKAAKSVPECSKIVLTAANVM